MDSFKKVLIIGPPYSFIEERAKEIGEKLMYPIFYNFDTILLKNNSIYIIKNFDLKKFEENKFNISHIDKLIIFDAPNIELLQISELDQDFDLKIKNYRSLFIGGNGSGIIDFFDEKYIDTLVVDHDQNQIDIAISFILSEKFAYDNFEEEYEEEDNNLNEDFYKKELDDFFSKVTQK